MTIFRVLSLMLISVIFFTEKSEAAKRVKKKLTYDQIYNGKPVTDFDISYTKDLEKALEKTKKEVSTLKEKLKKYESEIQMLKEKCAEKERDESGNRNSETTKPAKSFASQVNDFRFFYTNEDLKKKLEETREEVSTLKEKLEKYESEIQMLKEKCAEKELDQARNSFAAFLDKNLETAKLAKIFTNDKTYNGRSVNDIDLSYTNKDLEKEREETRKEGSTLKEKLEKYESEIQMLKEKCAEKKSFASRLVNSVFLVDYSIDDKAYNERSREETRKECSTLKEKLEKYESEIQMLKEKFAEKEKDQSFTSLRYNSAFLSGHGFHQAAK